MRRASQPVSNLVSRALASRNWSDSELAARTGLTRWRVNHIKNGRVHARASEALLIARAFGVTVEDLFQLNPGGSRGRTVRDGEAEVVTTSRRRSTP